MSRARAVCSECGEHLHSGLKACPRCKAEIEWAPGAHGKTQKSRGAPLLFGPRGYVIVMGIAVLAGYLLYQEFKRPHTEPQKSTDAHASLSPESAASIREVERLQGILRQNPEDTVAQLQLANRLHDLGMESPPLLVRAIEAYDRYLAMNPSNPDARVDLGIVCFELSRYDTSSGKALLARALHEVELVATTNQKHQPAAYNLGIIHLNTGNAAEATRWFNKAVAIDPGSSLGQRAKQLLEPHSTQ